MPSLLSALAENPALPPELLQRLVDAAPDDEFLARELACRTDLDPQQAIALAALQEDSPYGLAALGVPVGDPLAQPALAVALLDEGRGRPEWALALARHPDCDTRIGLASCPGLPDAVSDLLAADGEPDVAAELAHFTGRSDLLRTLAGHPAAQVRRGVAGNEATPPEQLASLLLDEEVGVRERAAGNPATPADAAARLATDHLLVRQALAEHPGLPEEAQRLLAEDEYPWVRGNLGLNAATAEPLLRRLATDADASVRRQVSLNEAVPLDLLAALALTVRIGPTLLDRIAAATPAELAQLAASPEPRVRMLAAQRRDLPAALRDRLASDADAKVVKSVAPHPGFGTAQLSDMYERFGAQVAATLATNPDAPAALLDRIAETAPPVAKALRAVARHAHASPAALAVCLASADARTAEGAAANPALPVAMMAALIQQA
ncbi:hypothetical protein [Streptomyces sp. NRRL WC-3742]|uniref:hypothetical protein n=1 Tax=Streptomyces sp. NRRL WC-3742 TaxID=1463934 RepID=UPI0004CA2F91|nr:hypothetical protein [Streptomyces sp. NRRL WC-3742]